VSNSASSIGPPGWAAAQRSTSTCQSGCASAKAATAPSSVGVPRNRSSTAGPAAHSLFSKSDSTLGTGEKELTSSQMRATARVRGMGVSRSTGRARSLDQRILHSARYTIYAAVSMGPRSWPAPIPEEIPMARFRPILAATAGFLMAAAAVALPAAAQTPTRGGTMNIIISPEPPTLMLGINQMTPAAIVGGKIYELRAGFDLKPMPGPPSRGRCRRTG
jgi:hypothetical protein